MKEEEPQEQSAKEEDTEVPTVTEDVENKEEEKEEKEEKKDKQESEEKEERGDIEKGSGAKKKQDKGKKQK